MPFITERQLKPTIFNYFIVTLVLVNIFGNLVLCSLKRHTNKSNIAIVSHSYRQSYLYIGRLSYIVFF